jgi:hypothetical protein
LCFSLGSGAIAGLEHGIGSGYSGHNSVFRPLSGNIENMVGKGNMELRGECWDRGTNLRVISKQRCLKSEDKGYDLEGNVHR